MIKHSLQFLFILLFAFCIAACSTDKVELEDTIENGGQTQPGETNEEEQQEYPAEQVQYCSLDTIKYRIQPTKENFEAAYEELFPYLGAGKTAQYCLRGGKNGDVPGAHAYQRQYCYGPDGYANYMTIPHRDFMYGTWTSTYSNSNDFNGDRKYGAKHSPIHRLALHARTLRFAHPITRKDMNFSTPIPPQFLSVVGRKHLDNQSSPI